MDNNKELAKLLGIKPEIYPKCDVCEEQAFELQEDGTYSCLNADTEKCLKDEHIYPDFTQPENFCKLLEIASKVSSIAFSWNGSRYGLEVHYFVQKTFLAPSDNIQGSFIEGLLWAIEKNTCKCPSLLDKLKQQAQNTEWRW